MRSFLLGLSLASAAVAQIVVDSSVVYVPVSQTTPAAASASPSADNNGYASSAPAGSSYYGSSAPAQYTQASSSSSAPPSQYTPPPSNSYNPDSYSSFTSYGYKSLDCGYGYSKGQDGSCQQQSWVCHVFFAFSSFILIPHSIPSEAATRRSSSIMGMLIFLYAWSVM